MKQEINQIREEIDSLDRTIILSLDKRMELVKTIGEIKKKKNLPVLDSSREKEILNKADNTKNCSAIKNIFLRVLEESKRLQARKSVIIATLGPEGTCSENTVKKFISDNGLNGKILLKCSFQDCITALKSDDADFAIIPSAFKELNELIFKNLGEIDITESFVLKTPALVFANKDSKIIKTIATHPSPSFLAEIASPQAEKMFTLSNSISALKVASGEADACITTEIAAKKNNLTIIKNFGEVPMTWNVFRRLR